MGADANVGVPILAPLRNVVVTGSNNDYEVETAVNGIWARSAKMSGYLAPRASLGEYCGVTPGRPY